jgi:hypothetical protein
MQTKTTLIGGIPFAKQQPTELSFAALETWVIWQFTRKQGGGLCGSVHPSIAGHGWYPALIFPKEKRALVYAHQGATHATPEEASDSLPNL